MAFNKITIFVIVLFWEWKYCWHNVWPFWYTFYLHSKMLNFSFTRSEQSPLQPHLQDFFLRVWFCKNQPAHCFHSCSSWMQFSLARCSKKVKAKLSLIAAICRKVFTPVPRTSLSIRKDIFWLGIIPFPSVFSLLIEVTQQFILCTGFAGVGQMELPWLKILLNLSLRRKANFVSRNVAWWSVQI